MPILAISKPGDSTIHVLVDEDTPALIEPARPELAQAITARIEREETHALEKELERATRTVYYPSVRL